MSKPKVTTIREKIKQLLKGGRTKEKYLGKKPDGRRKEGNIDMWFLWYSSQGDKNYVRRIEIRGRKTKTYRQWSEWIKEHTPVIEPKYRDRVSELIGKNLYLKDFIGWRYVSKRSYTVLAQVHKTKRKGKKKDV